MSYLDNTGVSYLWSKIKAAFAAKSHSHAAGDITSGTLGAARIPNLSTDKLTSGTLPIARGGTGATTAATARANIDAVPNGAITPYVEATNILSDDYASGDYVIVESSGTLYVINGIISQGTDISTSSNANKTTVVDEIERVSTDAEDALDGVDEFHGFIDTYFPNSKLPVIYGGTGQSGVSAESVIANIASAGSSCSITSATFHQWGKVAQLYIAIKVSAAKSSGDVLATLVTGKRPVQTTPLMNTANINQFCAAYSNGQIQAKSSLTSGTTVYVVGTYVIQ